MKSRVACLSALLVALALPDLSGVADGQAAGKARKVTKTEAEWAKQLTSAQYHVCRQKGTEPPFTGKYVRNHARGIYACVCCGAELFPSRTKFESGTGWPSFWAPIAADRVDTDVDFRTGEQRVEVMCNDCGAHLGHVFNDGPPPTGLRYCMNSVALKFVPEKKPAPKPAAP